MKKRILALFLAAIMILSLAACGSKPAEETQQSTEPQQTGDTVAATEGNQEEEPVLLRIWFLEHYAGDEQLISDYINNLPQVQEIGVQVEICKWNWDQSNLNLQLAGDEQMDIGWDSGSNFINRVDMNAYVDLTPYLENDPDFYNAIPESLWTGVSLNGGIYGVPTYKELGEQWALTVDKEVLEKTGIDYTTIRTWADAEPLLAAMKEQGLGAMYVANYTEALKVGLFNTFDFTPYNLGVIRRATGEKIENLYETQEFVDLVNMMYDWNKKGYIPEEGLTDMYNWIGSQNELYHNFCLRYTSYAPYAEKIYLPEGYDVQCMFLEDPVITNDATRGSIFGIYQKCKNPEKAYEFLKLWNTDPAVKNAIAFGVEGVHYNLVDGQVELIPDAAYCCMNWASGNVMISYTNVNEPKDKYEQYEIWNQSAVDARDLGLVYDFSAVSVKVTNCTAVLDEYLYPLILGFVEPESGIAQLRQKLKDAGIDDVIAAQQAQYEAYLATK